MESRRGFLMYNKTNLLLIYKEEIYMRRNGRIALGIVTIILVFASSAIGLGLLPNSIPGSFIMRFILIVTPCITILTMIHLLIEQKAKDTSSSDRF
jgi:hypothetical protein